MDSTLTTTHMNRTRSAGLAGIITAGFLLFSAAPASAHTSTVSHTESCSESGTTMTVVTFDNDYSLAADVSYRWGTETPGTAHMAAKTGSTNTTVSLPSHPVGTLTWYVTWADGFRQPTQGEASLTVQPLAGCHPVTTTSTLLPPLIPTTTLTTAPATTTSTAAPTTSTTAKATVLPSTTTTAPTGALGTNLALPRTGAPIAFYTAIGLLCLLVGAATLYVRQVEKT